MILTVEMALFDDRFCTANLHDGPRRPPLPSVPMNELSGLIVVPDLPVRVDATQPLLLRALVTALGASFDARILPVPVWELRLDYDNAALVGFGAVVGGVPRGRLALGRGAVVVGVPRGGGVSCLLIGGRGCG